MSLLVCEEIASYFIGNCKLVSDNYSFTCHLMFLSPLWFVSWSLVPFVPFVARAYVFYSFVRAVVRFVVSSFGCVFVCLVVCSFGFSFVLRLFVR